jgi:hypothetical protein
MEHSFLHNMRAIEALLAKTPEQIEASRQLWLMTSQERVAAFWRGDLTFEQCLEWGRRRPDEPPRVNGEFAHIYITTADYLERPCPVTGKPVDECEDCSHVKEPPYCLATGKPIRDCSCSSCHDAFVLAPAQLAAEGSA